MKFLNYKKIAALNNADLDAYIEYLKTVTERELVILIFHLFDILDNDILTENKNYSKIIKTFRTTIEKAQDDPQYIDIESFPYRDLVAKYEEYVKTNNGGEEQELFESIDNTLNEPTAIYLPLKSEDRLYMYTESRKTLSIRGDYSGKLSSQYEINNDEIDQLLKAAFQRKTGFVVEHVSMF